MSTTDDTQPTVARHHAQPSGCTSPSEGGEVPNRPTPAAKDPVSALRWIAAMPCADDHPDRGDRTCLDWHDHAETLCATCTARHALGAPAPSIDAWDAVYDAAAAGGAVAVPGDRFPSRLYDDAGMAWVPLADALAVPPADAAMRDLRQKVQWSLARDERLARDEGALPTDGRIVSGLLAVRQSAERLVAPPTDALTDINVEAYRSLGFDVPGSGAVAVPPAAAIRDYADKQRRDMLATIDASEGSATWAADAGEAYGDIVRFIDSLGAADGEHDLGHDAGYHAALEAVEDGTEDPCPRCRAVAVPEDRPAQITDDDDLLTYLEDAVPRVADALSAAGQGTWEWMALVALAAARGLDPQAAIADADARTMDPDEAEAFAATKERNDAYAEESPGAFATMADEIRGGR